MRTIALIMASALTVGCASSRPVRAPDERIALVMDKARPRAEGFQDAYALNQLQALVHASVVVERLSEIDERSFDAVVVLQMGPISSVREHSYDASADKVTVTNHMPVAYDVRRGGSVVHSGQITLVMPQDFNRRTRLGNSYLQNVSALLRDVSVPSTPPAVRTP